MTLHYIVQEDGDSDILLIHGWAGATSGWQQMIDFLDFPARWWAVDLPGHGQSPGDEQSRTINDHVEAVIAFIETHGIKPQVIIGHSTGGLITLKIAHQRPDLLQQMVLISPVVTGKFAFGGMGSKLLQTSVGAALLRSSEGLWPVMQDKARLRKVLAPLPIDEFGREAFIESFPAMDVSGGIELLIDMAQETMEPYLRQIMHPTFVAVGGLDVTVPPSEGRLAAKYLRNAEFITVRTARHRPFDTHPDEFIPALRRFLERYIA